MSTTTDELRRQLQRRLGFTGGEVDSDIGKKTIAKINSRLDQLDGMLGIDTNVRDNEEGERGSTWKPLPGQGHLTISQPSLDALVSFEVSSESYYNKRLSSPTWPGWSSGVTIGIGYDLGYNSDTQIEVDWSEHLPSWMVKKLMKVSHYRGKVANGPALRLREEGVKIPFSAAKAVFEESTLPRFAKIASNAYDGLDTLYPDAQGAILSLVFNRGASMKATDKRSEMRALRPAIKNHDLEEISSLLLRMRRHWSSSSGLYPRRTKEAELVLGSNRRYDESELIVV